SRSRVVEIGLGSDSRFALGPEAHQRIAHDAARLGYSSLWTPTGSDREPFDICAVWHEASGLATGIAVVPLSGWSVDAVASVARETFERCSGRFTLGVGSGRTTSAVIRSMREAASPLREGTPGMRLCLGAREDGPHLRAGPARCRQDQGLSRPLRADGLR